MISKNVFLVDELPYESLSKIGFSKSDFLNFPRPLIDSLISGGVTPLLMASVKNNQGEYLDIPLKLQLIRNKEGKPQVIVYPVRKDILNDQNFSKAELEKLTLGDVVRKDLREGETRTLRYFQLDNETKSIIKKDASQLHLSDRIKQVEKLGNIELGLNQKKALFEGKPIEIQVGDNKVTVGVDLKQPTGFRNLQGDIEAWKEQQAAEYDRLTPGFMGYVKKDANLWEYQQVFNNLQHQSLKETSKESKVNTQKLGV